MQNLTAKQKRMIERAIDRLVDLQDEGLGCQEIGVCLEKLNSISNR